MKKVNWLSTSLYALAGCVSLNPAVQAGGYQIKAFNAPSLGQANAGSAAQFGLVEYLSRNPALIAYMDKIQVAASTAFILPYAKFKNQGSTLISNPGVPIQGGNGGNGGKFAAVPTAYIGWSYNDRLKFAIGATSEWGLETSYNKGWVGRYHNLHSSMRSITLEPAFAYKINEQFAFGAGLNIQYMHVKLTRAIDVASGIRRGILLSGSPAAAQAQALGAVGLVGLGANGSDRNDSHVKLKGDDWGFGFSTGFTWQPQKSTKIGVSYRSRIKHTLKGNKTLTTPDIVNTRLNTLAGFNNSLAQLVGRVRTNLANSKISANVKTPDAILLGASHELNNQWTVLGELNWTHWALMKEIRVRTTSVSGVEDDVTSMKWRNTVSYALGLNYRPVDLKYWTFRTGIAYDPTPVKKQYRIPAIPDNDRYWLTAGVGYEPNKTWNLAASYAYEYLPRSKSELRPTLASSEGVRGNLIGKTKASVHIVSVQAVYRF